MPTHTLLHRWTVRAVFSAIPTLVLVMLMTWTSLAPHLLGAGEQEDADPPVCGNGRMESAEQCDDGNLDDLDACSNACRRPVCGGQYFSTWAEIQCRKPGQQEPNGLWCNGDCTYSTCGNGVPQLGEQCDDGADNGSGRCTNSCTFVQASSGSSTTSSTAPSSQNSSSAAATSSSSASSIASSTPLTPQVIQQTINTLPPEYIGVAQQLINNRPLTLLQRRLLPQAVESFRRLLTREEEDLRDLIQAVQTIVSSVTGRDWSQSRGIDAAHPDFLGQLFTLQPLTREQMLFKLRRVRLLIADFTLPVDAASIDQMHTQLENDELEGLISSVITLKTSLDAAASQDVLQSLEVMRLALADIDPSILAFEYGVSASELATALDRIASELETADGEHLSRLLNALDEFFRILTVAGVDVPALSDRAELRAAATESFATIAARGGFSVTDAPTDEEVQRIAVYAPREYASRLETVGAAEQIAELRRYLTENERIIFLLSFLATRGDFSLQHAYSNLITELEKPGTSSRCGQSAQQAAECISAFLVELETKTHARLTVFERVVALLQSSFLPQ